MEWFDSEERKIFYDTASKYGEWSGAAVRSEDQVARVGVKDFGWELMREGGRAGLPAAALLVERGGAGLDRLGQMAVLERMAAGLAGPAVMFGAHWAALTALAAVERADVAEWLGRVAETAEADRPELAGVAWPAAVVGENDRLAPEWSESAGGLVLEGEFICPLHPSLCSRVVVPLLGDDGRAAVAWAAGNDLAEHAPEAYPGTGLLELPLARIKADPAELSPESLLAAGDAARAIITELAIDLHLSLSAVMVGSAHAASAYAWDYAHERIQTGRPIFQHQEVRKMLESMKTQTEAARAMIYAAAGAEGPDRESRARRAFLFAGSACETVCLDAIQTLGGYGYMKDYGLERRLRDVKTIQSLTGSYALDWIGG